MQPTHNSDEECYQDTLDATLKKLWDDGIISVSVREDGEFIFFMTDEQKALHDFDHH